MWVGLQLRPATKRSVVHNRRTVFGPSAFSCLKSFYVGTAALGCSVERSSMGSSDKTAQGERPGTAGGGCPHMTSTALLSSGFATVCSPIILVHEDCCSCRLSARL